MEEMDEKVDEKSGWKKWRKNVVEKSGGKKWMKKVDGKCMK